MRIDVLTLFPEMFEAVLQTSILKRAIERKLVEIRLVNFRDYSSDKHHKVDDRPYGGGPGMILRPEPILAAVEATERDLPAPPLRILLSPQGHPLDQPQAMRLAQLPHLLLICGHYEGFDERIRLELAPLELSIGDYVLTGGELPAMVLIDAVTRLLPGALGDERSPEEESHTLELLEGPHYTRPVSFRGREVPKVLRSGDHRAIAQWRRQQAELRTRQNRPDLLAGKRETSLPIGKEEKEKVPYLDLPGQYQNLRGPLQRRFDAVMGSASFILRKEVSEFERWMAAFLGVGEVIGVANGTDALQLVIRASGIGPGDEVITVAHTFVATVASLVHCGARPVLVDIRDDFNINPELIEAAVTPRTKAILPVHMNGRSCDMEAIDRIARRHRLLILEDAAQAIGARYRGRAAGTFGRAGAYSLHPMKTLGVAGDGGFIATEDPALAETLRTLRNHGQRSDGTLACFGFNSRLDNLQAAIALEKGAHLSRWIEARRRQAERYHQRLHELTQLTLPRPPRDDGPHFDTFNSYVVRTAERDRLKTHLEDAGIQVFIHWPVPLHRQADLPIPKVSLPETEQVSRESISLPIHPELSEEAQDRVIRTIRRFFS
jgi:tRNA (guanine-N1)-methyltransferase